MSFNLKMEKWGYRVLVKDDKGVSRNRRATRDNKGNPFKTKKSAILARNEVISRFNEKEEYTKNNNQIKLKRSRVCEIDTSNKSYKREVSKCLSLFLHNFLTKKYKKFFKKVLTRDDLGV